MNQYTCDMYVCQLCGKVLPKSKMAHLGNTNGICKRCNDEIGFVKVAECLCRYEQAHKKVKERCQRADDMDWHGLVVAANILDQAERENMANLRGKDKGESHEH